MDVNPIYILCLILSLMIFSISSKIIKQTIKRYQRLALSVTSLVLALVSLSIPITYVLNSVGENPLYATFRAYPYTELLIVLFAPLMGCVNGLLTTHKNNSVVTGLCLIIMLSYVSLPFAKPLIRPLQKDLQNKWSNDVALQSSASTCGPSSLATIFKYYGKEDTEANIAKQAYTSASSTENWYLARYADDQGFNYQFLTIAELDKVPTPAIIGVRLGSMGHFITLLNKHNGLYEIADSLSGKSFLSLEQFNQQYRYTGFVLNLTPR